MMSAFISQLQRYRKVTSLSGHKFLFKYRYVSCYYTHTIGAELKIFFGESGKSMLHFQFRTIGQTRVIQCGHLSKTVCCVRNKLPHAQVKTSFAVRIMCISNDDHKV
jgi:hypothetical protein